MNENNKLLRKKNKSHGWIRSWRWVIEINENMNGNKINETYEWRGANEMN
jgi:hypothetical protein